MPIAREAIVRKEKRRDKPGEEARARTGAIASQVMGHA